MTRPERVVFDANVFFQALTSPFGPAARLLELASGRDILLFFSSYVIDEIRDVTSRPRIVAKYRLDVAVVAKFIEDIRSCATFVDSVPHVFEFGRDPDDAHYVDLAIATNARHKRSPHRLPRQGLTFASRRHYIRRPRFHQPLPSPLNSYAARSAKAARR